MSNKYLCDDGNAEIEIEADSAEEAAQEYVDGGDWGDRSETCWIDVYVEQIIVDGDQRRQQVEAAIEYVHSHDDDTADADGVAEAFEQFFGSAPDETDDPWSDLCSAISDGDTVADHEDMLDPIRGDRECITITLDAEEPDCEDGESHDWRSPYSVLGGLKENPGVWGHGGGVVITEVCAHCGRYRVTDTWAQRPDTGEQGLTSVEYRDADEDSIAWLGRRAKREVEEAMDAAECVKSYEEHAGDYHIAIPDGADVDDYVDQVAAILPRQWVARQTYDSDAGYIVVERK